MHTLDFPVDIFSSIIEHLVVSVGIYKAMHLRLVNRAFDSEIMFAVFTRQVVDPLDPATTSLYAALPPTLQGRVLLARPLSRAGELKSLVALVTNINQALDDLTKPNKEQQHKQHRMISEAAATAINPDFFPPSPPRATYYENIFCGAIVIGNLDLVKALLPSLPRYKANIDHRNDWFGTPLHIAASWGYLEIAQYLLDCGADPVNPLKLSDKFFSTDNLQGHVSLDGPGHSGRTQIGTALRAAALSGYEQIVKLFLKPEYQRRFHGSEYQYTILSAARGGHISILDWLLQNANPAISDTDPLWHKILNEAIRFNREAMVRDLVHRRVRVDSRAPLHGRSVIMTAAIRGYARMARFLLDNGAQLEHSGEIYFNAITFAAERGHEEAVDVFLEYGASLESAFIGAVSHGQARLVQKLLQKGIDIHATGEFRVTIGLQALLHGISIQNPTIISLMVDAGVPLEGDEKDHIPVVYAKIFSSKWIVDFLLSLGAKDREVSEEARILRQGRDIAFGCGTGQVKVSQRTWEWVGKY